MIDFTIETRIGRPPADVFAYVTDPERLSSWQTDTVSAVLEGEGPLRVGSRLHEVHRAMGGKELESLVEVTELEPDRAFALHVVEGLPIDARIALEPAQEGTLMAFRAHGQPAGIARLLQPLLRRALERQLAGSCETLKRLLEE